MTLVYFLGSFFCGGFIFLLMLMRISELLEDRYARDVLPNMSEHRRYKWFNNRRGDVYLSWIVAALLTGNLCRAAAILGFELAGVADSTATPVVHVLTFVGFSVALAVIHLRYGILERISEIDTAVKSYRPGLL